MLSVQDSHVQHSSMAEAVEDEDEEDEDEDEEVHREDDP